jgi:hypothetical protein
MVLCQKASSFGDLHKVRVTLGCCKPKLNPLTLRLLEEAVQDTIFFKGNVTHICKKEVSLFLI